MRFMHLQGIPCILQPGAASVKNIMALRQGLVKCARPEFRARHKGERAVDFNVLYHSLPGLARDKMIWRRALSEWLTNGSRRLPAASVSWEQGKLTVEIKHGSCTGLGSLRTDSWCPVSLPVFGQCIHLTKMTASRTRLG